MIWPLGSVRVRAIVNDPAPMPVRLFRPGADSQRWTYSLERLHLERSSIYHRQRTSAHRQIR
jgi:hypothetical protein